MLFVWRAWLHLMDDIILLFTTSLKQMRRKGRKILLLLFSIIIPSAHLTLHMYVVVMHMLCACMPFGDQFDSRKTCMVSGYAYCMKSKNPYPYISLPSKIVKRNI